MALRRQVYKVNCQDGGMNGNPNQDTIESTDFIDGSRNFYLYSGGRQKRGGTSKSSATVIPVGGGTQLGLFEYIDFTGIHHSVVHGSDGKFYADYNATPVYSGLDGILKSWGETYQGAFFITDGNTKPKKWIGGALLDFSAYAADWGAGSYPSVFLKHGQQASQRLWGFALAGFNKYNLYASSINTDDFSAGVVVKLNIDTHDGIGIIGGAEYGERLMMFGKKKAFIVLDTDPNVANWGYQDVQWEGGASNRFLIVKTQNDIVCMTDEGDIYSVTTVINFGDYKAASLTRPSYMHIWIQNNVDLSQISKFHAVYDSFYRRIVFFVVRFGQTQVDTALVFWIDRPLAKAWSLMDNRNFNSGYKAACSFVFHPHNTVPEIRTGDYTGFSWRHDQSAISDDNNPYDCRIVTPPDPFDNQRETKHYWSGRVVLSPAGNATIGIDISVDGADVNTVSVPVNVSGSTFGSALYGTGAYGAFGNIEEAVFDIGAVGKRIQYTFFDNNVGEAIYIAEYMTDFMSLGIRP